LPLRKQFTLIRKTKAMETTPKPQSEGIFKPAISNASIISVALIILTLIFYLLNQVQSTAEMVIGYVIFLAGLIYSIKIYRDENLGGYISYGQSVGFSLLLGVFTGIITGIFIFVLYSFIAPELLEELRQKAILETERRMLQVNPNVSDSELDTIINLQLRFLTPGIMFIASVFSMALQGLIMGLIVSIFMKRKNPDPFASAEV
jgi:hypothetical protein